MLKVYIVNIILVFSFHLVFSQENEFSKPNLFSKEKMSKLQYHGSKSHFVDSLSNLKIQRGHQLFIELLGGGGYYSFGYELTLINKEKYDLSLSIGITSSGKNKPNFNFGIPISANNRFYFWKFNGIDLGLGLGNYINYWAIKDREKYFECPLGNCEEKIRLLPNFYLGWVFDLDKFSVSPRFYAFKPTLFNTNSDSGLFPWLGLKINYKL